MIMTRSKQGNKKDNEGGGGDTTAMMVVEENNMNESLDEPLTMKCLQVFFDKKFEDMKSDLKESMSVDITANIQHAVHNTVSAAIDDKIEVLKEHFKKDLVVIENKLKALESAQRDCAKVQDDLKKSYADAVTEGCSQSTNSRKILTVTLL